MHLAYWNLRGQAQISRYTLEASGVAYEETRYEMKDAMNWFQKDKLAAKHPLANLPLLTDGDIQVTEHDAVVRYIAKRFKPDLFGYNDAEYSLVESFFSMLTKLRVKINDFANVQGATEESRADFVSKNKADLLRLETYAKGKKFLVGEHLTIADIYLYEIITILKFVSQSSVSDLKNLTLLAAHFETQEWLKKYKTSGKWLERTYFGPRAAFNN